MVILGLSVCFEDHFLQDNAACLVVDGEVVSVIDTKRFPKIKNNETSLPTLATVGFVLNDYGIQLKDVDKIAVLGTENHLNNMSQKYYLNRHRRGGADIRSFMQGRFQKSFNVEISDQQVFFINPHLACAMNSFAMSGYDGCLLLSVNNTEDGYSFMVLNGEKDAIDILDYFPECKPDDQKSLGENVLNSLIHHGKNLGHTQLCLTGNKAPPASFEEKILSVRIFEDIFTQPLEHPANWAVGAGLYLWSQEYTRQKPIEKKDKSPRTNTEKKLAQIWQKILAKQELGINDNFFHLGGNSLKAIVMENEIHKAFDVKLPLAEIFKYPTIKELSRCIDSLPQDRYMEIEPVEKKEYYRLSSAQQRMYFIQQMDLTSTAYNIPKMIVLDKQPDKESLENAIKKLVARHESFRTSFLVVEGEPAQKVHRDIEFEIEYCFPSHDTNTTNKREVEKFVRGFVKPFDLSKPPLLRISLIILEEIKYTLLMDIHHIMTDGVSDEILVNDFNLLYGGKELPSLRIHYKDYAQWQKKALEGGVMVQQEQYWLEQFRQEIPVLDLPTDYPRPEIRSFEGDVIDLEIPAAQTEKIMSIAKEAGITLNILLLAAYNVLLTTYSNQQDIVVGVPTAGRHHQDLNEVIGMFVNMLPIRCQPNKDMTFKEFLLEVKRHSIDAYENQDYQFDDIVVKLGLQGNPGRNPLFDTLFVVQNAYGLSDEGIEGSVEYYHLDNETPRFEFSNQIFDLYVEVAELNNTIMIRLGYSTVLFKKATAEMMAKHYIDILHQIRENLDVTLKEITLTHDFLPANSSLNKENQTDFRF